MTDFLLDFNDIVEAAKAPHFSTAKDIRSALPIGYVLQRYGIVFDSVGDKLSAICPFHNDQEESFDVFGEHLEFWGCHPCYGGIGGDVVDLIRAFEQMSENDTPEAIALANEYVAEMETVGYNGPREGKKRAPLNLVTAEKFVTRSFMEANTEFLDAFTQLKKLPFNGQWLHTHFGVGSWANLIVIPFYNRGGTLATYRRRYLSSHKPGLATGSDMDGLFYNHWRMTDDKERPIVLCEGESDTWITHYAVGATHDVLGIPTGAGDDKEHKEPPQAHLLTGRRIILAFDGDNAGRAARQAWYEALIKYDNEVWFAPVPDGYDMCTVEDPKRVIELATRTLIQAPHDIRIRPGLGYVRPARSEKGEDTELSNWYFDPVRELVGEEGLAYEGVIEPGNKETILSSFDLKAKGKTIDWAVRHGRYWSGSDRDSQLILGMLQAEGPFLAAGHMASIAGLNDKHFVYPGGKIGPEYWKYVPPTYDVNLATKIHIQEGEWSPNMIHTLRRLHRQDVMDPFLAWLAVAPLRSLLNEFPPLNLTGSSGTGKTTLTETVIQFFSGSSIANNLTSTTKHALFAYLGSTNAFPVWFDEYRPGARKDAIIALEQIIRDAFTAQESSKGGMRRDNWAAVESVAMRSPLVVTGEDSFTEQSHTERMILIGLPMEGRDPAVLTEVRAWGETGFPHAYLSWLQRGLMNGDLPEITNRSMGDLDLPDRQRINYGILMLGWSLLTKFMNDHGESLSAADFTMIVQEAKEAMNHHPIEDAMRWCFEEQDAGTFMFSSVGRDGEEVMCVRVENFVNYIETHAKGIFTLPGGVTAVRRHLMTKYGAYDHQAANYGISKRVLALRPDVIQ